MISFNSYLYSLPKALEEEEQDKLLKEFYETRDDGIRDVLITHNLRLVASCVKKFNGVYRDLDELMSIGTQELMNIIDNKFDISKGVKLSTYAWEGIYRKLYYEVNRAKLVGDAIYRTSNFANPYNPEEMDVASLQTENDVALKLHENIVGDSEDFRNAVDMQDFIESFLSSLNESDRYIAIHTFGLDGESVLTQHEMAEELKISSTLVGLRQNKIKTSIREYYLNKEEGLTYDDEVASVIKYIAETDNEEYKLVLEHYYGLNGKNKMNGADIARLVGRNPNNYVTNLLKRLRAKGLIAEESPKLPIDQVVSYINNCDNMEEIKILEHYFGLNGKEKCSKYKIAGILGTTDYMVSAILEKLIKKIEILYSNGFACDDITKLEVYSKSLTNNVNRLIFNHTFMLHGSKYLTPEQLSKKMIMPEDRVLSVLDRLKDGYREFISEEKQPN